MNSRRELLIALCASLLSASFSAVAQQRASPRRVGVLLVLLSPESEEAHAFRQGLRDAGYVEGRDVVIEWRSAIGDYSRLPDLAADLVRRKVDVIVADTTLAVETAKRATSTIPIVMTLVADPVGTGVAASLAHPGGNATGLSIMLAEHSVKRLQLLKEMMPRLARVAVLWNPPSPYQPKAVENLKAAAPSLAIDLSFADVRTAEQFDAAFLGARQARAQAIYVLDSPLFFTHRTTLVTLASRAQLPLISGEKAFADAGGLMTYGANYADQMRRSAGYVDKIFKGANPGTMPIEQPIKFDLVINMKTAKALDIAIPSAILLRAEQLIK